MGVDFYKVNDKSTVLFSLSDQDFENLKIVLSEFRKLTGIIIDQYATTRISNGHVQLISRILTNHISSADGNDSRLKSLLINLKSIETDVIAVGD